MVDPFKDMAAIPEVAVIRIMMFVNNFNIEKDIEIIKDGGWHFNNLYNFDTISKKLEAFPHKEFNSKKYSDIKIIEKKINNLEDLFDRGHKYEKIKLDNDYPKYILNNLDLFKDYIL